MTEKAKIFVRWPERLALMEVSMRLGITEEEALSLAVRSLVLQTIAGREVDLVGAQQPTDQAAGDAHPVCRGCADD